MKRSVISLAGILAGVLLIGVSSGSAVPITVTFTGDNVVGAWYQNGGAPIDLGLDPLTDSTLANWQVADSRTIDLGPGTYQLIWCVVNSDTVNAPANNPGAFLAEISAHPSISFQQGSFLTSTSWEVALVRNSLTAPTDFNALTWNMASLAQEPDSANGGSNIWTSVNHGAIAGISTSAQWIWTDLNFADPGAPDANDAVYFKVTVSIPDASTLFLLGSACLVGFAGARRRFKK
jgi:hypothetical protein